MKYMKERRCGTIANESTIYQSSNNEDDKSNLRLRFGLQQQEEPKLYSKICLYEWHGTVIALVDTVCWIC